MQRRRVHGDINRVAFLHPAFGAATAAGTSPEFAATVAPAPGGPGTGGPAPGGPGTGRWHRIEMTGVPLYGIVVLQPGGR